MGASGTFSDASGELYTISAIKYADRVKVSYNDQKFLGLDSGEHWAAIKASICPKQLSPTSWIYFSLVASDGGTYTGLDNSFKEPFPKPLFPDDIVNGIPAGPCRTGWVYFPVTDGADITTIVYQDGPASISWTAK